MGFFRKKTQEKRENEPLQYVTPWGEALTFGTLINRYSSMNISAVFAATNLISNTIAMLPIKVLINGDEGKNEMNNHPLNLVLGERDNDNLLSRFNLIKMIVQSVIIKGNAFCYIQRAQDGSVMGLRYLEAGDVTINYNKQKDMLYYDCPIISKKHIEPIDMLHFVLHSYDGITGISILSYAARTLGITNASENAAKSFFENGMNVNGLLKVNTPINQKQKDEIRQSWQQAYSGNGGGLAIINGNMEYQQLTLSPEDSQLLSSRQFNVADIARFFNINPLLLGAESGATYSSLEMLQNAFLVHTLQPYIAMIESEFNRKLLKPSESNLQVILETNDLMRIDKQSQANYYKTMVDAGILSRNEVRKEIGYNGFEGGDEHTIAYSDTDQNTLENNEENTTDTDDTDNEE